MTNAEFIAAALAEDVGTGDYSTLASIPTGTAGEATLKIKDNGIIAGVQLAEEIFRFLEPETVFTAYVKDGDRVERGATAFNVQATVHTILKAERLTLNCMQRMSGIATLTRKYVDAVAGYNVTILDTRKTTPLFRKYEKTAVAIGGGSNHRMGLYDMVMLKDNHIDFCGGIEKAIKNTIAWLQQQGLDLKIEVETRNIDDVRRVMDTGGVHRVMMDNYTPGDLEAAVALVNKTMETEASGGINLSNIAEYAKTGVDYISCGAIVHQAVSLDLSLKARIV